MSFLTTFDSTKEALLDLLQSIKVGKTQLPDFQCHTLGRVEGCKNEGQQLSVFCNTNR